jgi:hypothetical protein
MATIQGIQFENDANGKPISIKINLEKYGAQLEPFLKQIGILEEKDEFDTEWENAIPLGKAKEMSIEKIRSWWKK